MHKQTITHIITPLLYRHFSRCSFLEICRGDWSVKILFPCRTSIVFSCPRDLDVKMNLCEISIMREESSTLDSYFKPRLVLQTTDEILRTVYEAFLKYNVLDFIMRSTRRFYIQCASHNLRGRRSLAALSIMQLSTHDLAEIRSMYILPTVI